MKIFPIAAILLSCYLHSAAQTGGNLDWLNLGGATGGGTFTRLHLIESTTNDANITIENTNTTPSSASLGLFQYDGVSERGRGFAFFLDNNGNLVILKRTNNSDNFGNFVIQNTTGNVGIGTTSPGSYKLAVEGTIGARKVKVTNVTSWADHVFTDAHHRPSLLELDAFIQAHKHLPGIPVESAVKRDGVDLAEMNVKLLEKVEELTLYVIELKKELDALKNSGR